MSETKELKRICELLNCQAFTDSEPTNLDLIKVILNKLSDIKEDGEESEKNLSSIICSLAFPEKIRNNRSLIERPDLWNHLKQFNDLLRQDYMSRRQMLLNRLDCTVESFKWKATDNNTGKKSPSIVDQNNPRNDLIHEKYETARVKLSDEPDVTISQLLAIRETECDNLLNSVASSNNTDCKISYKHRPKAEGELMYLKRVVIPAVPDRGGRTSEVRAPQKETIFQQRRARGRGGRRY